LILDEGDRCKCAVITDPAGARINTDAARLKTSCTERVLAVV